jgi:hypothetical protein
LFSAIATLLVERHSSIVSIAVINLVALARIRDFQELWTAKSTEWNTGVITVSRYI